MGNLIIDWTFGPVLRSCHTRIDSCHIGRQYAWASNAPYGPLTHRVTRPDPGAVLYLPPYNSFAHHLAAVLVAEGTTSA